MWTELRYIFIFMSPFFNCFLHQKQKKYFNVMGFRTSSNWCLVLYTISDTKMKAVDHVLFESWTKIPFDGGYFEFFFSPIAIKWFWFCLNVISLIPRPPRHSKWHQDQGVISSTSWVMDKIHFYGGHLKQFSHQLSRNHFRWSWILFICALIDF